MDEQRILDEMERMLAADDPRLAARLAAFGQPGFGQALRTRRARATLSVMVLVLIAAVAAVIYLMSVLKPGNSQSPGQSGTPPPVTQTSNGRHAALRSGSSGTQAGPQQDTANITPCAATLPPPKC
jgi:hypothetical protein